MARAECDALLRWALPRLGLSWPGFRRVSRQVCRRIGRRVAELRLSGIEAYRARLESDPGEWAVLDAFCRIPISRFFRDRTVFEFLGAAVLPALADAALARGDGAVRAWCAGIASGEEPYSLAILWRLGRAARHRDVALEIVATDADPALIERAREARYRASSLDEVPEPWREAAFERADGMLALRTEFRAAVRLAVQDLRRESPPGPFDLVLCRNLAFTYFARPEREAALKRLVRALRPHGALVVGMRERLPAGTESLRPWAEGLPVYRRDRP